MGHDEDGLIRRIRSGDPAAFRELVQRHQERLYRLAFDLTGDHDEAEELSQEVLIKAHHALSRYRGQGRLMSWLYRIMVNTHIDHSRKKGPVVSLAVDSSRGNDRHRWEPVLADTLENNPERHTTARHIHRHVEAALQKLAPQQRAVFVLRHYHDLPLKEIARLLRLSVGTVKSHLFRAVQRLQVELAFYRRELGLEDPS